MMARAHVTAWRQTYAGLLPDAVIAARDEAGRAAHWRAAIAEGQTRIAVAPPFGFCQMGPQRYADLLARGFPDELHAIYLTRNGQGRGLGRRLLGAVLARPQAPFTALVVGGNRLACAFYDRIGGRLIETRAETIDGAPIEELVYAWDGPAVTRLGTLCGGGT